MDDKGSMKENSGTSSVILMARGMARDMAAKGMAQESATMFALCEMLDRRAPAEPQATQKQALNILRAAGGNLGALAEAGQLAMGKGEDYNKSADPREARDAYFPLGLPSYAQMIHVKSHRLLSFSSASMASRAPNFESVRDTGLDIINYGSFLVDWLGRCGPTMKG